MNYNITTFKSGVLLYVSIQINEPKNRQTKETQNITSKNLGTDGNMFKIYD